MSNVKRKLDADVWEISGVQAILKHAAAGKSAEEVRLRLAWASLKIEEERRHAEASGD